MQYVDLLLYGVYYTDSKDVVANSFMPRLTVLDAFRRVVVKTTVQNLDILPAVLGEQKLFVCDVEDVKV